MRGRSVSWQVMSQCPGKPAPVPTYSNGWPVRHFPAGSRLVLHSILERSSRFNNGSLGYSSSPYPTSNPSIVQPNPI